MKLASPFLTQGAPIPRQFTCDGENVSPPFTWSGAPQGTKSFLLVCNDPDAPTGTFHHWAAYNIPGSWSGILEGAEFDGDGYSQAVNDFGRRGYGGPCPPRKDKPHHYHFRLSALSCAALAVKSSATCEEAMKAARPHELAIAELVVIYGR
jgi:Raf kinase inhibitor-like YbhB/YbcL family protein